MKWYYEKVINHTHVRCFMNGALIGNLCFRNEEFEQVRSELSHSTKLIEFIREQTVGTRTDFQNEPDSDMGRMEHDDKGDN